MGREVQRRRPLTEHEAMSSSECQLSSTSSASSALTSPESLVSSSSSSESSTVLASSSSAASAFVSPDSALPDQRILSCIAKSHPLFILIMLLLMWSHAIESWVCASDVETKSTWCRPLHLPVPLLYLLDVRSPFIATHLNMLNLRRRLPLTTWSSLLAWARSASRWRKQTTEARPVASPVSFLAARSWVVGRRLLFTCQPFAGHSHDINIASAMDFLSPAGLSSEPWWVVNACAVCFLTVRLSLRVLSTTVVVVAVLDRSGRRLGIKQAVVDAVISIRSCLNKTVVRAHS